MKIKLIKRIIVPAVLLCVFFHPSFAQSGRNPFATLKYDKVVAYEYNSATGDNIIGENEKLSDSLITTTELTKDQISTLNRIIVDTNTYGGDVGTCFTPHLGIVYYYKNHMTAYISVSMACNILEASDKIVLAIPTTGFSKQGRKKLKEFTNGLHFKRAYQNQPSAYDN